ncbi:MAG: YHYH protein [Gemmatimonadota bacterium]
MRADPLTSLTLALLVHCCGCRSTAQEPSGTGPLAAYLLQPDLCADAAGPDCTSLRLGDAYFSTATRAVGMLFSCTPANPSAPGSVASRITWINTTAGTWNLLQKPWLPSGTFSAAGTYSMTDTGGARVISSNDLPVDGKIGDWPMTAYNLLTAIDPNPGAPAARSTSFTLSSNPQPAATPGCISPGAIGVTLNGVVIYNAADARGADAVAREIVDVYGGHPAMSEYHYHFMPERLDVERLADGHSGIVGYIRDGYPLYGYHGVGGAEMTNADLDVCHGHAHGALGYHYHATIEYPYTVGCYHGTPQ